MTKVATLIVSCFLAVFMIASFANSNMTSGSAAGNTVVIEIDYGESQPARTIEAPLEQSQTALDILQKVATVETHPVGEHVMVVGIDGIKGIRGEKAWYYKVNGKAADKLAFSKILQASDHVQWTYKKDVCSLKVDQ